MYPYNNNRIQFKYFYVYSNNDIIQNIFFYDNKVVIYKDFFYPFSDPRMEKSPLLPNGYHGPPFNPLQYMAGLGYPPMLPNAGGLLGGLQAGMPGGLPPPNPLSPQDNSPLKHAHLTPESLAR